MFTGWIQALASEAGIHFAPLQAACLREWARSTPIPQGANNPLGLPVGVPAQPTVPGTAYAAFSSMTAFRSAGAAWLNSRNGIAIKKALNESGRFDSVWLAIHSSALPAIATEGLYPHSLMAFCSQELRDEFGYDPVKPVRSAGVTANGDAAISLGTALSRTAGAVRTTGLSRRSALYRLINRRGHYGR